MSLKVPIRFKEESGLKGIEAERVFEVVEWYLLNERVFKQTRDAINKATSKFGLKYMEYLVLCELNSEDDKTTLSDLSLRFGINMPQMLGVVGALEKKNFVRSRPARHDRRVKLLSATRQGKKNFFEANEEVQRSLRFWMFDLSDSEIALHLKLMKRISEFERL